MTWCVFVAILSRINSTKNVQPVAAAAHWRAEKVLKDLFALLSGKLRAWQKLSTSGVSLRLCIQTEGGETAGEYLLVGYLLHTQCSNGAVKVLDAPAVRCS